MTMIPVEFGLVSHPPYQAMGKQHLVADLKTRVVGPAAKVSRLLIRLGTTPHP
jgi:hypothetical protein